MPMFHKSGILVYAAYLFLSVSIKFGPADDSGYRW
jgi:hypothetical protein